MLRGTSINDMVAFHPIIICKLKFVFKNLIQVSFPQSLVTTLGVLLFHQPYKKSCELVCVLYPWRSKNKLIPNFNRGTCLIIVLGLFNWLLILFYFSTNWKFSWL